jgi:DNA-3-methyladenine glycosylase
MKQRFIIGGNMNKLTRDFYKKSSIELSKDLLGKILVRIIDGKKISCRISEVEAYMGALDKAAHSYGGKRTKRTEIMYGESGFLYVFIIYGMYNCANIVAAQVDIPEAVLIRAGIPIDGLDEMAVRRFNKEYSCLTNKEKINLTNGPGKLCKAMSIDRTDNGEDLCKNNIFLEDDGFIPEIAVSRRIGIDYAEEAADFLWRFYIKNN